MALYVGVNYHPHDWPKERYKTDIELMKQAGLSVVRLGHLCWDSYEPEDGVYTFEWFDYVMDLFADAGIKVLLDVSMRPAPVWVHKLCPGCNIHGRSGNEAASLRRYMEDVSDPAYQHYALRFARVLVNRYKNHPALFAFGLCNELGDGPLSYSEYARERFVEWLKKKYCTIDSLNKAWTAQRWSRNLTSFDDVQLQENEVAIGSPESWLDMRRFFSDGTADFIVKLKELIEAEAPGVPHSSNHYAERDGAGFDYLKVCDRFVDYPGMGYYPGYDITDAFHFLGSVSSQRIAETGKPMWYLEFQTGSMGMVSGPKGALRMQGMLSLLYRAQMILGWTYRSMLGGEEQYLYGLLMHDGTPNANYYEYQKMAADMAKLQNYAFPYLPTPEIGVAYNYDSAWVSQYNHGAPERRLSSHIQFKKAYSATMSEIHKVFCEDNRDYNTVDLRNLKNNYKLIIIPGHIVMERAIAETIRRYVNEGGTVIMTGYSAFTDETGKVFSTPRPGYLEDVFGIRIAGFYRTNMTWLHTESSLIDENSGNEILQIGEGKLRISASYYEEIELHSAGSYVDFYGKDLCAVSVNSFGEGKAYYIAAETDKALLSWMIASLQEELGLEKTIMTPPGVQARRIAENQTFYVNTTNKEVEVNIMERGKGVLSENTYSGKLCLMPYDAELIVSE